MSGKLEKTPKEDKNMKVKTETLEDMTKDELVVFAQENAVALKNVKGTRKADLISAIAEAVNKTVRGRKNRIKAAVLTLLETRGVNETTLVEFIDCILAVYPEWDKANNEPVAKKHLSWYKSFVRKQKGQLLRPRKAKQEVVQPEQVVEVPEPVAEVA